MIELVPPDLRLHASWAAAVQEFAAAGDTMHGSGLWSMDTTDLSHEALAREVERLRAQADPATDLEPGWVHCTYRWIAEGEEFLGYVAVRHGLNDFLLDQGGHVGYSVRPGRRRQGHASRALSLALDEARRLGLDRVLLTCDHDNTASRLVIERGGGVLEDRRGEKLRYWISL